LWGEGPADVELEPQEVAHAKAIELYEGIRRELGEDPSS